MLFTGQTEATIDAKFRLAIPSKFRARWNPDTHGATWYCVPWPEDGVLRLYTEKWFESAALKREETLTPAQDAANLESTFFGNTEQLDVDANFRVRLPGWHLELIKLPREVMVIGAGNRLEVRSRELWLATQQSRFQEMRSQVARQESRSHGQ